MKLTRYNGHVPLFSQDMEGRERTLFGSAVQDDDINNQFTPEFLRGWGSVGSTEFPTLQDFNALAYTHNKLLSYLYQAGIPIYSQNEEYYIGSIVQYNKDIYICLRDKPTVLPTDANAWKRVQESLTFVGNGPEVMKRGAGGWLGNTVDSYTSDSIDSINNAVRTGVIRGDGTSKTSNVQRWGGGIQVVLGSDSANNKFIYRYQMTELGVEFLFKSKIFNVIHKLYSDKNTRTDKNNVLHAGTTTPINTLNVSDMSQEVINNDLLTVTSGAVYRALQTKADLTYVNAELNKKANLNYVNTELGKKITGGNVVQTTGQSTVDVMSQKAYTDLTIGIGQSWVDVTSQRLFNTKYTNTSPKPIQLSIQVRLERAVKGGYEFKVDDKVILLDSGNSHIWSSVISAIIPSGSSYFLSNLDFTTPKIMIWSELRQ